MIVYSYRGEGDAWRCDDAGAPAPDAVAEWLEASATTNLGTPMSFARRRGIAFVSEHGGALRGVAVVLEGGRVFLEASDDDAARALVRAVRSSGVAPTRVLAALPFASRPAAVLGGELRTQRLLAMVAGAIAEPGEGRVATDADLDVLADYQALYDAERGTQSRLDWRDWVRRGAVWVHELEGVVASVLLDNGRTSRFAAIGGTFTFPHLRRRGSARALTAWAARRLLSERPRVHLIVDEDNRPAIALYRSLGFEEIGRCVVAYPA